MSSHRVIVQRLAFADLDDAYRNAALHAPGPAGDWLERFRIALQSLDRHPDRCPLAYENPRSSRELREFLFGRRPNVFRVVFTIDGDTVRILRVRRSARRSLTRGEIERAIHERDS